MAKVVPGKVDQASQAELAGPVSVDKAGLADQVVLAVPDLADRAGLEAEADRVGDPQCLILIGWSNTRCASMPMATASSRRTN